MKNEATHSCNSSAMFRAWIASIVLLGSVDTGHAGCVAGLNADGSVGACVDVAPPPPGPGVTTPTPGSPEQPDPETIYKEHLKAAREFLRQRNWRKAIQESWRALKLKDSAEARFVWTSAITGKYSVDDPHGELTHTWLDGVGTTVVRGWKYVAIENFREVLQNDPPAWMAAKAREHIDRLSAQVQADKQRAEEKRKTEEGHKLVREAIELNKRGDYKGAERAAREALRILPDSPHAYRALGLALLMQDQGRYAEAEAAYRESIRLDPDIAVAHNNLGLALELQNKLNEAAASFHRAMALDPSDTKAPRSYDRVSQRLAGRKNVQDSLAKLEEWLTHTAPVAGPAGGSRFTTGSKTSAPVDLSFMGPKTPPANTVPKISQSPPATKQKGVRYKEVPLPPAIQKLYADADPFGGTPYGWTTNADLILDALETGNGDLEKSVEYLRNRVKMQGSNIMGTESLSYVEGLYISARAEGADKHPSGKKADDDHYQLVPSIKKRIQWPKNPKAGERAPNPHRWETRRTKWVLDALEAGQGDIEKSFKYLQSNMKPTADDPYDASNAYYYLLGLSAYTKFQGQRDR